MCMSVMFSHMSVRCMHAVRKEDKRRHQITGVTDGCELLGVCLEPHLDPLKEQGLLMAESSFQAPNILYSEIFTHQYCGDTIHNG